MADSADEQNGENQQVKKIRKKKKSEDKNVNDLKKRIEKIHAGENLVPIASNFTHKINSAKRIRIYRNGDAFHKGINIVLNMRHEHDINTFLETISERIGLIHGAKRLYTLQGHLIRSTKDLENNKEYVASSGNFIQLPYGSSNNREWHTGHHRRETKRGTSANAITKDNSSVSLTASKKSAPGRLAALSRQSRSVEPKRAFQQQKREISKNTRKREDKSPKTQTKNKTPKNNKKSTKNKIESEEFHQKEFVNGRPPTAPKSNDGIDDSSEEISLAKTEIKTPRSEGSAEGDAKSQEDLSGRSKKTDKD